MKALIMREIDKPLTIEDRPEPKPANAQVVVGLKAAALNRRDYWVTQGLYPGMVIPVTLGSDGAGVVTKIGLSFSITFFGYRLLDPHVSQK